MFDRIRTTDAEVDQFVESVEQNPLDRIVELMAKRNREAAIAKAKMLASADHAVNAAEKLVESTTALAAALGIPTGSPQE